MAKLNGKNADELAMKAVYILRPHAHRIYTANPLASTQELLPKKNPLQLASKGIL
jgi:hypothetical protein